MQVHIIVDVDTVPEGLKDKSEGLSEEDLKKYPLEDMLEQGWVIATVFHADQTKWKAACADAQQAIAENIEVRRQWYRKRPNCERVNGIAVGVGWRWEPLTGASHYCNFKDDADHGMDKSAYGVLDLILLVIKSQFAHFQACIC